MRADRLVATLLILQARRRVSATELARELEVSVKTARRDLEALAVAGVPVYAQPGRNGGWSLLGGARTDLSGLTADEARTLFLLVGPAARVAPEAKAALRKLMQALPEPFRAEASTAAGAIVIDPARWGQSSADPPAAVAILREAIIAGVRVRLVYADRRGHASERDVHPLGLIEKASRWYLIADTDDGQRTFRVDRVRSVEPTEEPAVRPEGFDLDAAWVASRGRIEAKRRRVSATVHAGRAALPVLREQFGDDLAIVAPLPGDRVALEIRRDSHDTLADELAGWGAELDVIAPDAVRQRLAEIGAALVRHYGRATRTANVTTGDFVTPAGHIDDE